MSKAWTRARLASTKSSELRVKHLSLLGLLSDMYGPPDMVRLRLTPSGAAGFKQDRLRIRSYFSGMEQVIGGKKK